MTAQLGLFDAPATRGTSRKRDRATSQAAARSMEGEHLTDQQRQVLEVVSRAWIGATAYECAVELGFQQSVMSRRIKDLIELGLARYDGEERPGGSGRMCSVAVCTERGLDFLSGVVEVHVARGRL
jgi:hypothetical protein